ncbi:FAD-binding oxidoreductase [Tardiphaga sp. 215_C5_N2_1]|uniref:FAD-binding oxidoreductase n=1 Tax=Tardiphaga sp. 215_C5_N2_1 TaxID=3240774 RepID=UPI003F8B0225
MDQGLETLQQRLLSAVAAIVGANGVLSEPSDIEGYLTDWRRRYQGSALAVAFPTSAEHVSQLVRLCSELGVAVVPQAGNTGFTGGAIPPADQPAMIINVSKMNKVRKVDGLNNSVIVEAGCILANLRDAVEASNRLFPMLLGSVGSCEVGGLVSTNAGGTGVLRYGNMRDLILGLEVVLPDGRIWSGLKVLRKDNSGYDLKQLFVGAEGTLGIVTAAALKLFPLPISSGTAMIALPNVQAAVALLRLFGDRAGNTIEAFEIMSLGQLENVLGHLGRQPPMAMSSPWYVLVELADSRVNWDPAQSLEEILAEAADTQMIDDAIVAADSTKAQRLWELRHNTSEANLRKGFSISNDTSVPVSQLPAFIAQVTDRLRGEFAGADVVHCGHIGDGNIHVVVILSRDIYNTAEKREEAASKVNYIVHEVSVGLDGSISAEHGIGMMHVDELETFKPALDLELMMRIKRALDPNNIMNPGKILRSCK